MALVGDRVCTKDYGRATGFLANRTNGSQIPRWEKAGREGESRKKPGAKGHGWEGEGVGGSEPRRLAGCWWGSESELRKSGAGWHDRLVTVKRHVPGKHHVLQIKSQCLSRDPAVREAEASPGADGFSSSQRQNAAEVLRCGCSGPSLLAPRLGQA